MYSSIFFLKLNYFFVIQDELAGNKGSEERAVQHTKSKLPKLGQNATGNNISNETNLSLTLLSQHHSSKLGKINKNEETVLKKMDEKMDEKKDVKIYDNHYMCPACEMKERVKRSGLLDGEKWVEEKIKSAFEKLKNTLTKKFMRQFPVYK